jgi:hypothetical protein
MLLRPQKQRTLPVAMILDWTIRSAGEYIKLKQKALKGGKHSLLVPVRPKTCPGCGAEHSFWVKGYYWRWFVEWDIEEVVPVPRYICRCCHLVLSVLFAFLVPCRQFTKQFVAEAAGRYLESSTSYRRIAETIACEQDEGQRPHHTQVFGWVNTIIGQAAWKLNLVLQRHCVRKGKVNGLAGLHENVCPNSNKVHTNEKVRKLNSGARLLALGKLLLEPKSSVLASLQTYFLDFVQPPLSILTGRGITILTPHCSQLMIF